MAFCIRIVIHIVVLVCIEKMKPELLMENPILLLEGFAAQGL
jgi:hypothetical protein